LFFSAAIDEHIEWIATAKKKLPNKSANLCIYTQCVTLYRYNQLADLRTIYSGAFGWPTAPFSANVVRTPRTGLADHIIVEI